jgi:hypothetical protein
MSCARHWRMGVVDSSVDHEYDSHDSSTNDEGLPATKSGSKNENEESASKDFYGAKNTSKEEVRVCAASCNKFEVPRSPLDIAYQISDIKDLLWAIVYGMVSTILTKLIEVDLQAKAVAPVDC